MLNYFKHRIANAIVESTNNKIKTLKQATDIEIWSIANFDYIICTDSGTR